MPAGQSESLTAPARRHAIAMAYANGGLWAVGNGLTSTMLVVYLAMEYGALGVWVSLILASPRLLGLIRLAAPPLIARIGDRRRVCLWGYTGSAIVLAALPLLSAPGVLPGRTTPLAVLVVLWGGYHLLEFFATIALLSWLGDLVPQPIRGRFFGYRERWLLLGRVVGMTAAGAFAYGWTTTFDRDLWWIGYAAAALCGAVFMLLAVIPLAKMPAAPLAGDAPPQPWRSVAAALTDRRFWPLMAFGVWFSTVNGLTQTPQGMYPYRVLQLHLIVVLTMQVLMRLGQSSVSPALGRFADRYGFRPLLIGSQLLMACGPLFYFMATPNQPWWLIGAYLAWIAYAGLNLGLPALILKLSLARVSSAYVATYYAVTGFCFGLSTVAGGLLFDWMGRDPTIFGGVVSSMDRFDSMFLIGFIFRLAGVLLLMRIVEPGAWRWPQIVRQRCRTA